MVHHLRTALAGVLMAIATQTLIAVAETWSFGPSLRALTLVLGSMTFPVVTVVTLGIPIGCLYFAASRLLALGTVPGLLLLVGPFALLQLVGLSQGFNGFAAFYAGTLVCLAVAGALLRLTKRPGGSDPAHRAQGA